MTAEDAAPPPPPTPEPDDKDWTWVVDRPCDECGLTAGEVPLDEIGDRLRATAEALAALLDDPAASRRPAPTTWSALEYAAHVRDVCRLYLHRLDRMLTEDGPHYENWDQDATAREQRYDLQHPATVGDELRGAADELATAFDEVTGGDWERTGFRSDGAAFTVATFARYLLHDPVHHLWDARQGLDRLADDA